MDANERRRIDREIRRLNAEFGMGAGRPGVVTWIVAGLLIITLVGAMMLLMPTGPGEAAVGRVNGISLVESDQGTRLLARVTVGAVQELIPVPAGAMCAAGDRIDLVKSKTRLNVRYALGPGGCMKPG